MGRITLVIKGADLKTGRNKLVSPSHWHSRLALSAEGSNSLGHEGNSQTKWVFVSLYWPIYAKTKNIPRMPVKGAAP